LKPIYKCRVCGAYTERSLHCGTPARLLLDPSSRTRLSKLMSGVLRHFPEAAGLSLDREGFADIRELVNAIRTWEKSDYSWVTEDHVLAIALLDPKGRFEIRNGRIRARYGHSVRVRVEYEMARDISALYHGTQEEKLARIRREGLRPMKRLYVHLSSSIDDAWENARRRGGVPVVLVVDAGRMLRDGIPIYKASPAVYLASYVPPRYIVRVLRGRWANARRKSS